MVNIIFLESAGVGGVCVAVKMSLQWLDKLALVLIMVLPSDIRPITTRI